MFPYWKNSFVSIFRDLALLCSQSFLWRFDNLSLQHYVPLNAKFIEVIYWSNTNFPIYMESSKKLYKLKPPVYLGPTTRLYFLNQNLTGTTIVRVSTKVSQNKTQTLHNNRAAQYSRFMPRLLPQPWKLVYVYLTETMDAYCLSTHMYQIL